jgi:hypothetical protein
MLFSFIKHTFYMHLLFIFFLFTSFLNHPHHVGVIEIEYNSPNNELQIAGKWFVDDVEEVLYKKYKVKKDLVVRIDEVSRDSMLINYFKTNLMLSQKNKNLKLDFIGAEHEKGALWLYFVVRDFNPQEFLTYNNQVLCDLLKDQSHITHFLHMNKRESFKSTCNHSILKYKW